MKREEITKIEQVKNFEISKERLFYSAEHHEILNGTITDIYFVRTYEILKKEGLLDTEVTAEIFARKQGIFAGVGEVKNLLAEKNLKVWALREGDKLDKKEVVMRITGPYGEFGLHETAILGILASSSGWATAANEAKEAAGGKPVFCFGARHVHPSVAPVMERAAIIGGADGASCILGAKLAGKEPVGTVPHAVFLIVGDTVRAARTYHETMPKDALRLILVDTFKDEAEEALRVAEALQDKLDGIRLDTPSERGGVTPSLVREVRARLDMAGYENVKIFASGGLYPEKIILLSEAGVDAFGVGSFISSHPPIDMTMDIKEIAGKPVAKRGRIPGITPTTRLERII
ncbi:MAG: nicotinate phosphoribosyltransferase [Clostridia bacterium]|nr:nicotinate phosphoribosyltransferase [Clostridiales bacterium]MDK2985177.1 nicotinate phosphoribosyltransferase [Clostridia bacterium]